jgi:hypothetical protein
MSPRTFHKTVIQIVVLSEEPYPPKQLDQVYFDITEGDCSGDVKTVSTQELNGAQVAQELLNQGSDPAFFSLTRTGEDAD